MLHKRPNVLKKSLWLTQLAQPSPDLYPVAIMSPGRFSREVVWEALERFERNESARIKFASQSSLLLGHVAEQL